MAEKRTHFEPATLPLIKGAKPARHAKGCRKTPLHWKRTMDKMLDAVLEPDMIKKVPVSDGTGDFLFEAFLALKPKDPTGPPRLVVDYSPMKHCFDGKPFKQTDPFSILTALKSGMKTRYWQIRLVPGRMDRISPASSPNGASSG